MATKTFAPQWARRLQQAARYYAKHQAKIEAAASAQQTTDSRTIVAAINNSWNAVPTVEQP